MLFRSGFDVIQQQDVGNLEFKRAIRRFGDAMVDAESPWFSMLGTALR